VTISWCLRLRRGDHGHTAKVVVSAAIVLLLFVALTAHPALAATGDLRVVAVHTASAPRVSMILDPPGTAGDEALTPEAVSVTVDGSPVTATVTPMASRSLSVALVIDTASDLSAEELGAVKSGALDLLLTLPEGAQTMVVASGGSPSIVAPLSPNPAEAVSAISDLRLEGTRSTAAGTLLAAQELAKAPLGPRAIIVANGGPGGRGPSVEQLTEAISRAEAFIGVVQTGANDSWSQVVDRTGGTVLETGAADVVQSYGRLATALGEQFLVAFQAPGALPAVAEVAVETGDVQSTAVVRLPPAGISGDAGRQPSAERESADTAVSPFAFLVAGLVVMVLAVLALVLRARQRRSAGVEEPPTAAAGTGSRSQAPGLATATTEDVRPASPSNGIPQGPLAAALPTSPLQSRPQRGSLTAAVQGRRSAQRAIESKPEPEVRPIPQDQQQRQDPLDDTQLTAPAADSVPPQDKTRGKSSLATRLSGIRLRIAGRVARDERSAEEGPDAAFVLTGSGNAVVDLNRNAPSPAVVRITGNPESHHFGVRALGTEDDLVVTLRPYHGIRPLDWSGAKSTGFEVTATGPWKIEVLPLSSVPRFSTSFKGRGDMVVHFTGDGSLAKVTGNNTRQYFYVRAFGPQETDSLVNTTEPYSGSCQISREAEFFEVRAVGSWTITIE
jgi:hypothetical protein